jgi:SagB-type dehydrogenase family enzyme
MPEESSIERGRYFLKDTVRRKIDFSQVDQHRGIRPPPIEKPFPQDGEFVDLVSVGDWNDITAISVESAIRNRQSRRSFTVDPLTLDELSFLLWATQGLRQQLDEGTALRTVPSAGARHAFETYVCIFRVSGLKSGFYRYLPAESKLLYGFQEDQAAAKITAATLGQSFVAQAAVVFIWTTIPYRMEWRYGVAAYKTIAIDAGHVCQNLYLACEAIGAGTCAVAAYHQELMDQLLRIDGRDEFVIYLAPVGKLPTGKGNTTNRTTA